MSAAERRAAGGRRRAAPAASAAVPPLRAAAWCFRRRRNQVDARRAGRGPGADRGRGPAGRRRRQDPADGPPFLCAITGNGLFVALTALTVVLPLFLPMAVAVVSGDAVAGEAYLGTLRYLLAVPVARTRLLLVKYAGAVAYCAGRPR